MFVRSPTITHNELCSLHRRHMLTACESTDVLKVYASRDHVPDEQPKSTDASSVPAAVAADSPVEKRARKRQLVRLIGSFCLFVILKPSVLWCFQGICAATLRVCSTWFDALFSTLSPLKYFKRFVCVLQPNAMQSDSTFMLDWYYFYMFRAPGAMS